MKTTDRRYWAPRVLGLASASLLGLWAFDALDDGGGLLILALGFALRLVPALAALALLRLAWSREYLGGWIYLGVALAYLALVPAGALTRLVIAGPLFLTGLLFLLSGWTNRGSDPS